MRTEKMNIHTLFIILIFAALAMGIYGTVVVRGANLVRIDKLTTLMAFIWGVLELAAALVGHNIGSWILMLEMERERDVFWTHLMAGAIFAAIGIRMLIRAFQGRTILEHRMENVDIRTDAILSLRLCAYACFAGIGFGLLRYSLSQVLAASFVITAVFAAAGYISGRAYGVSPSGKAYALGGGLLCALSIALQMLQTV